MDKGFTLIECILVILLIAIVGASAYPLFIHHEAFQERFFVDEIMGMLRYANKVARVTGCEVQVGYRSEKELALFQRQGCTQQEFSRQATSPYLSNRGYIISIPQSVSLKGIFPIYIDQNGKVYDDNHHLKERFAILVKKHRLMIDGKSGLVYEDDGK